MGLKPLLWHKPRASPGPRFAVRGVSVQTVFAALAFAIKSPDFGPNYRALLLGVLWPVLSVGPDRPTLAEISLSHPVNSSTRAFQRAARARAFPRRIFPQRRFDIRDQFVPLTADPFLQFGRPEMFRASTFDLRFFGLIFLHPVVIRFHFHYLDYFS